MNRDGLELTFLQRMRERCRKTNGRSRFWIERPLHGALMNKLWARRFAETRGVRVPRLYWSGRDPARIPFSQLPDRFVAKGTHGTQCRNVFAIFDGRNLLGPDVGPEEIVSEFQESPHPNAETYLVEEFVRSDRDEPLPLNYKVHTFGNKVGAIQVMDIVSLRDRYYTADWGQFDFETVRRGTRDESRPAPPDLDRLLEMSAWLGRAFGHYVRLDFLRSDRGFVFGELCATPGDVADFTPDADRAFGEFWTTHLGDQL